MNNQKCIKVIYSKKTMQISLGEYERLIRKLYSFLWEFSVDVFPDFQKNDYKDKTVSCFKGIWQIYDVYSAIMNYYAKYTNELPLGKNTTYFQNYGTQLYSNPGADPEIIMSILSFFKIGQNSYNTRKLNNKNNQQKLPVFNKYCVSEMVESQKNTLKEVSEIASDMNAWKEKTKSQIREYKKNSVNLLSIFEKSEIAEQGDIVGYMEIYDYREQLVFHF